MMTVVDFHWRKIGGVNSLTVPCLAQKNLSGRPPELKVAGSTPAGHATLNPAKSPFSRRFRRKAPPSRYLRLLIESEQKRSFLTSYWGDIGGVNPADFSLRLGAPTRCGLTPSERDRALTPKSAPPAPIRQAAFAQAPTCPFCGSALPPTAIRCPACWRAPDPFHGRAL